MSELEFANSLIHNTFNRIQVIREREAQTPSFVGCARDYAFQLSQQILLDEAQKFLNNCDKENKKQLAKLTQGAKSG